MLRSVLPGVMEKGRQINDKDYEQGEVDKAGRGMTKNSSNR